MAEFFLLKNQKLIATLPRLVSLIATLPRSVILIATLPRSVSSHRKYLEGIPKPLQPTDCNPIKNIS